MLWQQLEYYDTLSGVSTALLIDTSLSFNQVFI
jgi:hypothetical protein